MIGELPAETVHANLVRHRSRPFHLRLAVVVGEEDVAPVDEREIASSGVRFIGCYPQVANRLLEITTLAIDRVGLRSCAIDRECDFVDTGSNEPTDLILVESQTVRAGVKVDVRELCFDVFAHLDGALVEKGLA